MLIKIGIIVPKDLVNTAKAAAEEFEDEITVLQGSMAEGISLAKQLEECNYDVIITRGGTQILLVQSDINIPILSVPITPVDIFEAISEAEKISDSISLIVSHNVIPAIESYIKISGKELEICQIKDELEVEQKTKELAAEGKRVIVGIGTIAKYAYLYGLVPIVIKSGREAFVSTIKEAKKLLLLQRRKR